MRLEAIIASRWAYFTVFTEFADFFMSAGQMVFATFGANQDVRSAEISNVPPLLALAALRDSPSIYPPEAGTPFTPEGSMSIHKFFPDGTFVIIND